MDRSHRSMDAEPPGTLIHNPSEGTPRTRTQARHECVHPDVMRKLDPRSARGSTSAMVVTEQMRTQSLTLDGLDREGKISIVGAMYDVVTGKIEFLQRTNE